MMVPHNAHVALVDGERFKVMRNTGPIFEPKLEMVAEPTLEETNFHSGVRHHDEGNQRAGGDHIDLNELAHGAAAAAWLNERALAGEIEQLVIVADPRTLGEMRQHYHKALRDKIVAELPKELTWESPQQIAETIAAA